MFTFEPEAKALFYSQVGHYVVALLLPPATLVTPLNPLGRHLQYQMVNKDTDTSAWENYINCMVIVFNTDVPGIETLTLYRL